MRVDLFAEAHMNSEREPGGSVVLLVVVMGSGRLERLRTPDLEDQH